MQQSHFLKKTAVHQSKPISQLSFMNANSTKPQVTTNQQKHECKLQTSDHKLMEATIFTIDTTETTSQYGYAFSQTEFSFCTNECRKLQNENLFQSGFVNQTRPQLM